MLELFEDSNVLLKGITKTIKNKTKEQKGGFLRILLSIIRANLIENMLTKNILKDVQIC